MSENKITVRKTARYFTYGNPAAKNILYVLHGYGQLAFYFLNKFEALAEKDLFIVAPEGMHRFYLQGTSGRVGASWMTRESRQDDIDDNICFLDDLHTSLTENKQYESVSVLGFSQGGATAARWKQHSNITFGKFILWASVFPEDVPLNTADSKFNDSENHFVLGTEDEYFNAENQQKAFAYFSEQGFQNHSYEGKHTIYPELLPLLFN